MKISGGRYRLCRGGWLLAALVLLGLNAFQFMSLEQQPLVGYSQTIKVLQSKLQDFDKMLAAGVFSLKDRIDLIETSAGSLAGHKAGGGSGTASAQKSAKISDGTENVLPTLTGTMQALDPRGGMDYRAVLNGRVCRVRDKIDNFIVVKISPTGVVVRRAGRSWTLNNPTPYFSSDQGN